MAPPPLEGDRGATWEHRRDDGSVLAFERRDMAALPREELGERTETTERNRARSTGVRSFLLLQRKLFTGSWNSLHENVNLA